MKLPMRSVVGLQFPQKVICLQTGTGICAVLMKVEAVTIGEVNKLVQVS